jgi:predicted kinase
MTKHAKAATVRSLQKKPFNMVIIVFGLPGSGKSYFASRLAGMMRAVHINSDHLRKEMFHQRSYTDREKAVVYNEMLKKAKEAIGQNKNVVLDATFHRNEKRELFEAEIKGEARVFFIEMIADEAMIMQRLKKERPDSEANFEVYKKIQRQWEPLRASHLILESTNTNADAMLQKAAQYLRNDKGPDQQIGI